MWFEMTEDRQWVTDRAIPRINIGAMQACSGPIQAYNRALQACAGAIQVTGSAGVSSAMRHGAQSLDMLVNVSRFALIAGGTPALPVRTFANLLTYSLTFGRSSAVGRQRSSVRPTQ